MNTNRLATILFFILFSGILPAQVSHQTHENLDSLKQSLKTVQQDTTRCNILNALIEAETDDNIWPNYNNELKAISERNLKKSSPDHPLYRFYTKILSDALNNEAYLANLQGDIPKALEKYKQSLLLAEKAGDKKGLAYVLNNLGSLYQYQGEIQKALEFYFKSLDIHKEVKDELGTAEALNNIGLVYNDQGNIPEALDFYNQSLKIQEKINDKNGMSISLNNIGAIFQNEGDYSRAMNYYTKSLKLVEEINNRANMAGCLHNIGIIYKEQGDGEKALDYFTRSLKISEENDNVRGMAHCFNSIAGIYNQRKDYAKALDYWTKSKNICEKINDVQGVALCSRNMSAAFLSQGKLADAAKQGELSLKLGKELNFPENIRDASQLLSLIYSKTGNWKSAYDMQVLYKQMNDTINNEAKRKAFIQKTFQYEYEKKAAADSIKAIGERRVFDAQLQQQKTQRSALFFGIGLIALFAIFMYNRFRVTQKQKQIIELKEQETQQQKKLVEEKHKEINDSITYAERIQRSFLASEELLNTHLKDYFILFQPKAIVSGDFYWAAELNNGQFAFAVADSTGHGVPGAIMSLLNITSLEKATEHHSDPAGILNHTRSTIIERLKNDGSEEGGKDGMDCSLIVFDFINSRLITAAAHNPIWIVRQSGNKPELLELSSDKMPVGKHDHESVSFTRQEFILQKGDMIFLSTDGFADQFGGPKGKKFMQKRLKELLVTISEETAQNQKQILEKTLSEWMADLEQVDDVTIAGIRI